MDSWEGIIVDHDEYFHGKSTIYCHCDECGEDFAIVDFDTHKILYLNPKKSFGKNKANQKGMNAEM